MTESRLRALTMKSRKQELTFDVRECLSCGDYMATCDQNPLIEGIGSNAKAAVADCRKMLEILRLTPLPLAAVRVLEKSRRVTP